MCKDAPFKTVTMMWCDQRLRHGQAVCKDAPYPPSPRCGVTSADGMDKPCVRTRPPHSHHDVVTSADGTDKPWVRTRPLHRHHDVVTSADGPAWPCVTPALTARTSRVKRRALYTVTMMWCDQRCRHGQAVCKDAPSPPSP